jgi:hypothetical protein
MKVKFLMFLTILLFACSSDEQQTPSLTIVNNSNTDKVITNVRLVGYEFSQLNIEFGSSQTFILDEGMSGGYTNINVEINFTCGARGWSASESVNFNDGDATTMNFLHCFSTAGYCRGVCFD